MRDMRLIAMILGICLIAPTANAEGADNESSAAAAKVRTVCQSCHGPGGNSTSATFPRLNGQQAGYIASQIKKFRSHNRSDPHAMAYMWGMASQLDDATGDAIAKYLASRKPTEPQTGGVLASEGKKIYMEGVDARNIPPCAACHGDHAEGNGEIPRLAGQHANYLKSQLEDFRSLVRSSDIMHANTKEMTDREIEAVVSFLANE
jgi:cytochrome c553